MNPQLAMTVSEVARSLKVADRVVRGWIASGELPAFMIGPQRGTRISVRAVEKFIAARTFNQMRPGDDQAK
jgi:excisionase family DNA binding protein